MRRRSAAYSLTASKARRRGKTLASARRLGFVSEDAPFDARRTAPMKPTPRFVCYRRSRRSQSAVREHAADRRLSYNARPQSFAPCYDETQLGVTGETQWRRIQRPGFRGSAPGRKGQTRWDRNASGNGAAATSPDRRDRVVARGRSVPISASTQWCCRVRDGACRDHGGDQGNESPGRRSRACHAALDRERFGERRTQDGERLFEANAASSAWSEHGWKRSAECNRKWNASVLG